MKNVILLKVLQDKNLKSSDKVLTSFITSSKFNKSKSIYSFIKEGLFTRKIYESIKEEGFMKETMQNLANEKYEVNGFIIEPHSTTKYDYSNCAVWTNLKRQVTAREGLMKSAAKSIDTIYDSEGVEIPHVIKKGGESFKLTQKK